MYDVTRRETFAHLSSWLDDARQHSSASMKILLVGNKSDLEHRRAVSREEGEKFAQENGLMFLECSAKTASNVEDAFVQTSRAIFQSIESGALDLNSESSGIKVGPGVAAGASSGVNPAAADSGSGSGGGCCG